MARGSANVRRTFRPSATPVALAPTARATVQATGTVTAASKLSPAAAATTQSTAFVTVAVQLGGPGAGAPVGAVVQHASAFSASYTNLTVTLPNPVTPGNILLAFTGFDDNPTPGDAPVSDDDPDTVWRSTRFAPLTGSTYKTQAWRARVHAAGTRTVTLTPPAGATFLRLAVVEVSGVNAVDQSVSGTLPYFSTPATIDAGTVTPRSASELVFGWMVGGSPGAVGPPGSGFTSLETVSQSMLQVAVGPPAGTPLAVSCTNATPLDGYVAIGVSMYYSPVPVLEQHGSVNNSSATTVAVTLANRVEKGNAVVALASFAGGVGTTVFADDASNTYTAIDSIASAALGFMGIVAWAKVTANGGTTVSLTPDSGHAQRGFIRLFVFEYSNAQDFDGAHASADGLSTAIQTTVTTTHANAIIAGQAISNDGTASAAMLSGSTRQESIAVESAYDAVALTAGSYTTGFVSVSSTEWLANAAAFYAPAVAVGGISVQAQATATATVATRVALTPVASASAQAAATVIAPGVLTPVAQGATQATALVTAAVAETQVIAAAASQATALVTATTYLTPQAAQSAGQATALVTASTRLVPTVQAKTQATALVAAQRPLLSVAAQAATRATALVTAPTPYDVVIDVDNPVSHWKLGDPSVAIDRKSVRDLPAVGGPIGVGTTLVANNGSSTASVFAPTGQTFRLSSSTDIGAPYNTATWTLELWMQRSAAVSMGLLDVPSKVTMGVFAGKFKFTAWDATDLPKDLVATTPLVGTAITHHIALTYDGTNLIAYVEGTEAVRIAMTGSASAPDDAPRIATGDVDGVIDEVAWYNLALPANRILAHYNAGTGITTAALVPQAAQSTGQATALVTAQSQLAPSAAASTQATALVTAPTQLTPTAQAATQATALVTAPTSLAPTAQAATQATALVTAPTKLALNAVQAATQATALVTAQEPLLSTTAQAQSQATAQVVVPVALVPIAQASAQASGFVTAAVSMTPQVVQAVAQATVTVRAATALAPTAAGASAATVQVTAPVMLGPTAAGSSAATVLVTSGVSVPALAAAATAATAFVTAPTQLTPSAAAVAQATALAKAPVALAPNAQSATQATATVTARQALVPTAAAATQATALVGVSNVPLLNPTAAASTQATATVLVTGVLVPSAASASQANATVVVAGQLSPLASSSTQATATVLVAALLVPVAAASTQATTTVGVTGELSPVASSSTQATATVRVFVALAPVAQVVTEAQATVTASVALTPTSAAHAQATATATATAQLRPSAQTATRAIALVTLPVPLIDLPTYLAIADLPRGLAVAEAPLRLAVAAEPHGLAIQKAAVRGLTIKLEPSALTIRPEAKALAVKLETEKVLIDG